MAERADTESESAIFDGDGEKAPEVVGDYHKVSFSCGSLTDAYVIGFHIEEGMNQITRMEIEFVPAPGTTSDADIKAKSISEGLLGETGTLTVESETSGLKRNFSGVVTRVFVRPDEGGAPIFTAEVNSWLWLLTQRANCKIFREMKGTGIFAEFANEVGAADKFQNDASGKDAMREHAIQYNETNFDFASRLLEDDGICYFIYASDGTDKVVLTDKKNGVGDAGSFGFQYKGNTEGSFRIWSNPLKIVPGSRKLRDYDFENPRNFPEQSKTSTQKGNSAHTTYEVYEYPGRFIEEGRGTRLVTDDTHADALRHERYAAVGQTLGIAAGLTFTLSGHTDGNFDAKYLCTQAIHEFRTVHSKLRFVLPASMSPMNGYVVGIEAVPSEKDIRPERKTPWPVIPGVQTARVVGTGSDEIYTDKYGRVRVRFHWDSSDDAAENNSCWVRCAMPWTGQSYGMQWIPRVDQECVVQFEEGNPDRPIIVGMVYNADNMPPYDLPNNDTVSGFKSKSSPDGSGFHELMFDDKNGEEHVRFQSERDYKQIIKNDAVIEIGLEHASPGDLTQKINNDKTEEIGNNYTQEVTNDATMTVGGNFSENITGTQDTSTTGAVTHESNQSITFKVSGSKIVLDPSGVTIEGPMVTIKGQTMTQVEGGTTCIVKGGVVLIN